MSQPSERCAEQCDRPDDRPDDEGIEINVIPDEIELPLRRETHSEQSRMVFARSGTWSTPAAGRAGFRCGRRRTSFACVRLTVESDAPGWNSRWPHWSYARASHTERPGRGRAGGAGRTGARWAALMLLVLPGEQRQAMLEFEAELDGFAYPGDFPFDIVLTDTESDAYRPVSLPAAPAPPEFARCWPSFRRSIPQSPSPVSVYRCAPTRIGRSSSGYLRGFEDAMEPTQALLASLA